MHILVTGFAPFGGETMNPSYEAVRRLPDTIHGHSLTKLELPVTFHGAVTLLEETIRTLRPDVLLLVGQAGGRPHMSVERIAINLEDARILDNEGYQPIDCPVIDGGENAYFATVPVKAMVSAMTRGGVPADLSYSAGSYVCNAVMYTALHLSNREFPDMQVGFIHVPYAPEQLVGKPDHTPAMEIALMVKGLTLAIEVL